MGIDDAYAEHSGEAKALQALVASSPKPSAPRCSSFTAPRCSRSAQVNAYQVRSQNITGYVDSVRHHHPPLLPPSHQWTVVIFPVVASELDGLGNDTSELGVAAGEALNYFNSVVPTHPAPAEPCRPLRKYHSCCRRPEHGRPPSIHSSRRRLLLYKRRGLASRLSGRPPITTGLPVNGIYAEQKALIQPPTSCCSRIQSF